jgi:putative ABC transport system permease protein
MGFRAHHNLTFVELILDSRYGGAHVGDAGLRLASAGALCGLLLSYYAANAMRALLAGVSPIDPVTLGGSVIAVFGMNLSGSLLPAIRAIRTDPTKAMRMH